MTGQNAENLLYDRSLFHVKALYGIGWARLLSVDMFFYDQISMLSLGSSVKGLMYLCVFHSQTDLKHQLNRNNFIAPFCLTQTNSSYCSQNQISLSILCTFAALIFILINAAIDRSHIESTATRPVTVSIYHAVVIRY